MNPRMSRMMMMTTNNGAGSSQFGGDGPSDCNTQYAALLLRHPFNYDPTSGMLENIVYSNHGALSSVSSVLCYYASLFIEIRTLDTFHPYVCLTPTTLNKLATQNIFKY